MIRFNQSAIFSKYVNRLLNLKITPLKIQKIVNGTRQYPFWFISQAIWCTYTARTTNKHRNESITSLFMEYIYAFIMTFGGREIAAYVLGQTSPLIANKLSIVIFTSIYILMKVPIIYKLFDYLSYFTGFLHGLNQERLYIRVFIKLHKRKEFYRNQLFFLIPAFCSSFDQMIGGVLGHITGNSPSTLSIKGVFLTVLLEYLHLSAVTKCALNKWIGYFHKWSIPNMYLAFALAVFGAKGSHIPKSRIKYAKEFEDRVY